METGANTTADEFLPFPDARDTWRPDKLRRGLAGNPARRGTPICRFQECYQTSSNQKKMAPP